MIKDKYRSKGNPSVKANSKPSKISGKVVSQGLFFVPIIMLMYLVLYLKASGFTWRVYFSNYDNAVAVWVVAYDFFIYLFEGIETVTNIIGSFFNFIVNWASKIIDYVVSLVEKVPKFSFGSIWSNLSQWAQNVIGGLFIT